MSKDPVFLSSEDGKWHFWDETWTETFGPYESEALAREGLKTYCDILNRSKTN